MEIQTKITNFYKKRTDETNQKILKELKPHYKICLLGNSMFERFSYTEEGQEAYNKFLSDKPIWNCGVGGDRLKHVLWRMEETRFPFDARSNQDWHIIILIGANDVEYCKNGLIQAEFKTYYERLIEDIYLGFGTTCTKISLLAVYPRKIDKKNFPTHKVLSYIDVMNFNIKQIADRHSTYATYYDFTSDVKNSDGSVDWDNYVDDVHFSSMGYSKFAQRLTSIM